jgi:hypothetical protein
MDFRDPSIIGTFPYHCHILQHEDGGMMGTIRVESSTTVSKKRIAHSLQPQKKIATLTNRSFGEFIYRTKF